MKHSIADLYRREWLDIAAHVYISALVNIGKVKVEGKEINVNLSAEDAIKRFQKWLNLTEDQLDTDALKSTYYRNQRRFIQVMKTDVKDLAMTVKRTNDTFSKEEMENMVRDAVLNAITELKEKNKVSV